MKNKTILIIILSIFCISSFSATAKDDKKFVRQGNKSYENKKYNEAEIKYRKALSENPENKKAEFNLGDALYKQGNYKEAGEKFELMNNKKLDKSDKNDIQYNLGNSYFEQGRQRAKSGDSQGSMDMYKKAIDSYKGALKLDGKDANARYNYELARRMLMQQQNQQNQQNKDNKNQNKDKKDQNKDQNKNDKNNKDKNNKDKNQQNKDDKNKNNKDQNKDKNNQNKDDKNKDQKNKDKNDNQNNKKDQNQKPEQQPQNPQPQKSKISDKDAERILNALQIQEKEKMNKMKKMKGSKSKIEKQW
jgi:Ca-activated chloride channel homolog